MQNEFSSRRVSISDSDIDSTVILMTDFNVVDLMVETSGGDIIDAGNATGLGITYKVGARTRSYNSHYR